MKKAILKLLGISGLIIWVIVGIYYLSIMTNENELIQKEIVSSEACIDYLEQLKTIDLEINSLIMSAENTPTKTKGDKLKYVENYNELISKYNKIIIDAKGDDRIISFDKSRFKLRDYYYRL